MIKKYKYISVFSGLIISSGFAALSGCAHDDRTADRNGAIPVMPQVTTMDPIPDETEAAPQVHDSCGAVALQYLVGKPKSEIPVPLHPAQRRVVCSSCVVTMDFSPYRQTIVFDTQSVLVQSVKCG